MQTEDKTVITKALHDNCVLMARKCFLLARNTLHGKRQHHKFYRVLHLESDDGEISGPHSWSNHVVGIESDNIRAIQAAKRYPYADYRCAYPNSLKPSEINEFDILLMFSGFREFYNTPDGRILQEWLPCIEFCCISFLQKSQAGKKSLYNLIKEQNHVVIATDMVDMNDTQITFLVTRRQPPPLDT